LKELPESTDPLPHTHIQFAHCYKKQAGWSKVLSRFYHGGGTLYDIEFLNDANGRRVAAFGFHAGFAGAAAGALAVAARRNKQDLGQLTPFENEAAMVKEVKELLGGSGKGVKALVIGALGRCGRGAVDLFRKIGLEESVVFGLECIFLITSLVEMISLSGIWKRLPKVVHSKKSLTLTFSSIAYILHPRYPFS
jgi:saccharopine dehydrogenase (NAD+, L-lysine-forming)